MTDTTQMRREIEEIPAAVTRLLTEGRAAIEDTAAALRARDPDLVITVARGSSDHAATFFKYACELALGLPVASVGPSVASVYNVPLRARNAASLGISQSGKSPDIVALARALTDQGAASVAITNDATSPLAAASRHTLAMQAGPELSVAATKTYVASLVAGLALVAHWRKDDALIAALDALPPLLEQAVAIDWPDLREELQDKSELYVLGRGTSYAVSNEAALKFKETCQIHAESYSSAEVLHGPVSVVRPGFPVLALIARDATEAGIVEVSDRLAEQGAHVYATSPKATAAHVLDSVATGHPLTDPIALITSFYAFVEKLAVARGNNPDLPRNLRKVTETV
ncbi:SIS domain-containing protein [Sinisalibacter aestuarii]|uniref:Glucosamine--fructose-6-phosphate aminotransferase n=1 Tax=Sinisalibacter aestuarii TaxID=2949426 RepID=A0ABQ5LQU1_9RHOB|nr:SIS domain-containing protein [Sinisalibacter aestuarii]GKY87374.1 glucosamine--fructose-6-phosphate aminotransferase [Sinisalibacter aestuarii]